MCDCNCEQLREEIEKEREAREALESELREEIEQEREARKQEREARKRAEARAERAERKADATTAHVRQLWNRLKGFEETTQGNFNGVHARISKHMNPDSGENDTSEPAPEDPPVYDLLQVPERAAGDLRPTERRTRFFFQNLSDMTKPTAGGMRVIRSGDLKRHLQTHESKHSNARIESKMVHRVMDLSKDLTRGVARIKMVDGEYRLKIPNDWQEQARREYEKDTPNQASRANPAGTAATTG